MHLTPNKWILAVVIISLVYLTLMQLGILSFYTLPTTSMEPNYPAGKLIIASNLASPGPLDVVAYLATTLEIPGVRPAEEGLFIGRIVGTGGDKLEIKDGLVYRNDQLADKDLLLKFMYQISEEAQQLNRERIQALALEDKLVVPAGMYLSLDEQEKLAYIGHEDFEKINTPLNQDMDFPAKSWVEEDWTMNHYGPIEVPPGHFFILGDNRNNSEDSRLRGFVPKEDVVGVVLNNFN